MKEPVSIITSSDEYTDRYEGEFKNFHQLHIFSVPAIYSTYYDPEYVTSEQVKAIADRMLAVIKRNSFLKDRISMFQKVDKYLITEDPGVVDEVSILKFDGRNVQYDYIDGSDDFFAVLGEKRVDDFFRNALISVGAEEIYSVIQPHVDKLWTRQEKMISRYTGLRALDKTDPRIRVEIYRIEKNYVPVKIKEFLCHSDESFSLLPEYQFVHQFDKRTVYIVKDIATGKTIDGTLNDAIESIKYEKWRGKNPMVFDPNDLMRMELDSDDPDYLSHRAHVKNDDRYEEGDNEYSPRH